MRDGVTIAGDLEDEAEFFHGSGAGIGSLMREAATCLRTQGEGHSGWVEAGLALFHHLHPEGTHADWIELGSELRQRWCTFGWGVNRKLSPWDPNEPPAVTDTVVYTMEEIEQMHAEGSLSFTAKPDVTFYNVSPEAWEVIGRALDDPDALCDDRITIVRRTSPEEPEQP